MLLKEGPQKNLPGDDTLTAIIFIFFARNVCVCEREREREKDKTNVKKYPRLYIM